MTFAQPRDLSYVRDEARLSRHDGAARDHACVDGSDLRAVSLEGPDQDHAPHPSCAAALGSSRLVLPAGPEAAKAARDFTRQTLRDWELDELVYDAAVIASELVTNAIRHGTRSASRAAGCVELAWQRQVSQVTCVVTDENARPPVLKPPEVDAECGRGLQVVQALAAAWGWTMLGPAQKAVWATLDLLGHA